MNIFTAKKIPLIALLLLSLGISAYSQTVSVTDSTNIYALSLEELVNLKSTGVSSELEELINSLIGVASKKAVSARKSPSIITLITHEEIANAGARDLIDVLRLVPGFDFGMDVQGVVGIGIRGNWAHEGKVLLLLDGQEMNETLFSNLQLGNNFNVDQIKRIEIIRGPGSAIYGGYAEYGVINIITRDAEDMNGVQLSTTYGRFNDTYSRRNINLSVGKKIGDFGVSISSFIGEGRRSNQDYTDIEGNSYNLTEYSSLNPANLNVGLSYKNTSFRGIVDNYETTNRDNIGLVYKHTHNDFKGYFLDLKHEFKAGSKLTITPRINYKRQIPWYAPDSYEDDTDYHFVADRYRASVTALYAVNNRINITTGSEYFVDNASSREGSVTFVDSTTSVQYNNIAFFAEALIKNRIINVVLGSRFDRNNYYGSAFVPRIGLTKKINKLSFKLLYASSFRAPGIGNIDWSLDGNIKPEKTHVLEFEAGYQFGSTGFLTANLFDITTLNPIIYFADGISQEGNYTNFPKTGSRGIELEYKIKDRWGYAYLNYSFYTTTGKTIPDKYAVTDQPQVLLAFPSHKLNLNSSFKLYKGLSLNPSATFLSKRYGYDYDPDTTKEILKEFKPILLTNLFFRYENIFTKNLNAGIGIYDIFNQKIQFIQPYNSGHAPLPGPVREFVIKLSYLLNF